MPPSHGREGEARVAAEGAPGVDEVGGEIVEPAELPDAGGVFGGFHAGTEFALRGGQGVGLRDALLLEFGGAAFDVELDFVGELGMEP